MTQKALVLALLALVAGTGYGAPAVPAALDSMYLFYAAKDFGAAWQTLSRLDAEAAGPVDRFTVGLEKGDYWLDKVGDYARAESMYLQLAAGYPKHKRLPDVLYRLALSQELQEKYLDAARNYEKVATRYSKSTYGEDALDAIERCFRKNYQDRIAYVDSYPVTRIELDDRISRNPQAFETWEKKQLLLDTMIDNRLLYKAGLSAGVFMDTAFVFNMGEARNRAVFQQWYDRQVTKKSEPSEKEVAAAYKKDVVSKYTTPEKVHAYQIQVATKAQADSLRALLTSDTTLVWDSVAKASSTAPDKDKGGDMGLFARGGQPKPVEVVAFKLKPGAISQPVTVADGFVILKVTEKKPKSVRTLADTKTQIAADLRQQNTSRLYEATVTELKKRGNVVVDTTAIEQDKETLAVVNGLAITKDLLVQRINAIPPFFRSQFETPEGKRRILDQLLLEKLLMKEGEAGKLWLLNKVVDQVLSRRATLVIDTYKRMATTDRVKLDSVVLWADYQKTLADFKEPTKVHAREIAVRTQARAEQLRRWVKSGRLPAMIQGRALLVPDSAAAAGIIEGFSAAANCDSVLAQVALVNPPVQLPRLSMVQVGTRSVAELTTPAQASGPYMRDIAAYGFGFPEVSKEDKLYKPELMRIETIDKLNQLLGKPEKPESTSRADTARLGVYVKLEQPLPAEFMSALVKLDEKAAPKTIKTADGLLLVKVVKRDTVQKATFADIARKFSTSGSRWSGGDLYWLAKDDKAHDAKLVKTAFGLTTGEVSPVIKLNDSVYAFVTLEERKEAYTRPFSEVQGKIDNKLRRERETALYDALVKQLRGAAKVEVLMKEADFEVEPLPETEPVPSEPGKTPQPAPEPNKQP